MLLGYGRIQDLGYGIQHLHIIDHQDNSVSQILVAFNMCRHADLMYHIRHVCFQIPGSVWRGILIPVRDIQGRIQGLQIRRDNVTRRKFRWVSSVEEPDGCKAESWAHLAGTPQEMVILTEGPMKADIIHALTGKTIIAIAGVNALSQLERMLLQLRQSGTKKIMTAFDMDFLSNPHVERGYENLTQMLPDG